VKKQFGVLALARLISVGLQAIGLVILARLVSVEGFGVLLTLIATQTTLLAVANMGITPYVLREYSREEFGNVRAALKLNTVTTVGAGILAGASTVVFADGQSMFLVAGFVLAAAISVDKNIEAQLSISIARGSHSVPGISIVLRAALSVVGLVSLALVGVHPILAFCVGRLVGSLVGLIQVIAFTGRLEPSAQMIAQRRLISSLWPLALSNGIGSLRALDTVVVTMFAGALTAGLYGAASRLLTPFAVVGGAMSSVLMPRSSIKSAIESKALIDRLGLYSLAATVLVAPLTLLSETVLTTVLGEAYSDGAGAFSWILVAIPVATISPLMATVLQAQDLDRLVVVNTAIFTPLTLAAAAVGAIALGATGAGASFAILTWLRATGLFIGSRRLR
jgi:O-antigen/teichoic acid export membrane protein